MVSPNEQRSAHPEPGSRHQESTSLRLDRPTRFPELDLIESELHAFYSHTYNTVRTAYIERSFDQVLVDDDYHQLDRIAEAVAAGAAVEAVGGWVDHVVTRVLKGATRIHTFGPTCRSWSYRNRQLLVDWSTRGVVVLDTTDWPTELGGGAQ